MALKRYLIFIGALYGAAMGGWEQFQADIDTVEEAQWYIARVLRGEQDVQDYGGLDPAFLPYRLSGAEGDHVCWQIVDSETRALVEAVLSS